MAKCTKSSAERRKALNKEKVEIDEDVANVSARTFKLNHH